MKTQSRIFMLSASAFEKGWCGVCAKRVLLKFRDASTGITVGDCCMPDLLRAEAVLTATFNEGLRHPTAEEASNQH